MILVESLEQANQVLSSDEKSFVCFTTRWCPPCRMINLSFEHFEEEHPDVKVYKIDVGQYKELAERMNATAVPVTFVVEHGHIVSSHNGFLESNELAKIFNKE